MLESRAWKPTWGCPATITMSLFSSSLSHIFYSRSPPIFSSRDWNPQIGFLWLCLSGELRPSHKDFAIILEDCSLVVLSLGSLRPGMSHELDHFNGSFFPGCIYLLSMYYKRWELQQRIVCIYDAISLILGLVLFSFNSRRVFRWSSCFRNCKDERS